MGGCCCCASRSADPARTPIYIYCPHDVEENEPLPTSHVASAAVPAGLLVDINLVTSIPDTYSAPPIPLPYDVGLLCSETVTRNIENCSNKTDNVQSMNSLAVGETVNAAAFENSNTCEGLIGSECKGKSDSPKVKEDEISKLYEPFLSPMEEDVCPTCLEEYDKENPRIITKCEHHFHLSCILEWTERSNTCPICDQIMVIDHTSEEYTGQLSEEKRIVFAPIWNQRQPESVYRYCGFLHTDRMSQRMLPLTGLFSAWSQSSVSAPMRGEVP